MNNIKCVECGLVNWATEVECKRCRSLLTIQDDQAEQLMAYAPEAKPLFSNGLKILSVLLGLSILSMVAFRVMGLEHSDLAIGIAVAFMLTGLVLLLLSHIWLLIRIFEQSIGWGLGSLCIPVVGLVAVIKFWEYTKRSFVSQLVCVGIIFFASLIAVR